MPDSGNGMAGRRCPLHPGGVVACTMTLDFSPRHSFDTVSTAVSTPVVAPVCLTLVAWQAGDALFIPEGWWHQVDSQDCTIAVNFWWPSAFSQGLQPHMHAYYLRRILDGLLDSQRHAALQSVKPHPQLKHVSWSRRAPEHANQKHPQNQQGHQQPQAQQQDQRHEHKLPAKAASTAQSAVTAHAPPKVSMSDLDHEQRGSCRKRKATSCSFSSAQGSQGSSDSNAASDKLLSASTFNTDDEHSSGVCDCPHDDNADGDGDDDVNNPKRQQQAGKSACIREASAQMLLNPDKHQTCSENDPDGPRDEQRSIRTPRTENLSAQQLLNADRGHTHNDTQAAKPGQAQHSANLLGTVEASAQQASKPNELHLLGMNLLGNAVASNLSQVSGEDDENAGELHCHCNSPPDPWQVF